MVYFYHPTSSLLLQEQKVADFTRHTTVPHHRFASPIVCSTTITRASTPCSCHNPPAHSWSTRRTYLTSQGDPDTLVIEQDPMASASSVTSTTSSGKRKRSSPPYFYAVKVGKVPAIYQTWDEANQNIQGFDRPVCESRNGFDRS
jgi:hypothetical protein